MDSSLLHGRDNNPLPQILESFCMAAHDEVVKVIRHKPTTSCGLDPLSNRLKKVIAILNILFPHVKAIVNASGEVSSCFKQANIIPLYQEVTNRFRQLYQNTILQGMIKFIFALKHRCTHTGDIKLQKKTLMLLATTVFAFTSSFTTSTQHSTPNQFPSQSFYH